MDAVGYTMETAAAGFADAGAVFDFDVMVDLPHLSDATDITMEIFAIVPSSGIGGFTICSATEESRGGNVVASPDTAAASYDLKENYPSVVS